MEHQRTRGNGGGNPPWLVEVQETAPSGSRMVSLWFMKVWLCVCDISGSLNINPDDNDHN